MVLSFKYKRLLGKPVSTKSATRPSHLPDFKNPPINEVVLGVQFSQPAGYQQIYSGEVWNLFRDEYPKVQEHMALQPAFETFGLSSQPTQSFNFLTGAAHDRFWFLNEVSDQLLQFQQDRLLHNWRKIPDVDTEYPRFEKMIAKFESELESLQKYMRSLDSQALVINQCEVSYINHIQIEEEQDLNPCHWLRFFGVEDKIPDDFNLTYREVIKSEDGKPAGRLTVEALSARSHAGKKIIRLSLTARAAPKDSTIGSALSFISKGRDIIVTSFADITTEFAQKKWGRTK